MPKPVLPEFSGTVAMLRCFHDLLDAMQAKVGDASDAAGDAALSEALDDLFDAIEQAHEAALNAIEHAQPIEGEEAATC